MLNILNSFSRKALQLWLNSTFCLDNWERSTTLLSPFRHNMPPYRPVIIFRSRAKNRQMNNWRTPEDKIGPHSGLPTSDGLDLTTALRTEINVKTAVFHCVDCSRHCCNRRTEVWSNIPRVGAERFVMCLRNSSERPTSRTTCDCLPLSFYVPIQTDFEQKIYCSLGYPHCDSVGQ